MSDDKDTKHGKTAKNDTENAPTPAEAALAAALAIADNKDVVEVTKSASTTTKVACTTPELALATALAIADNLKWSGINVTVLIDKNPATASASAYAALKAVKEIVEKSKTTDLTYMNFKIGPNYDPIPVECKICKRVHKPSITNGTGIQIPNILAEIFSNSAPEFDQNVKYTISEYLGVPGCFALGAYDGLSPCELVSEERLYEKSHDENWQDVPIPYNDYIATFIYHFAAFGDVNALQRFGIRYTFANQQIYKRFVHNDDVDAIKCMDAADCWFGYKYCQSRVMFLAVASNSLNVLRYSNPKSQRMLKKLIWECSSNVSDHPVREGTRRQTIDYLLEQTRKLCKDHFFTAIRKNDYYLANKLIERATKIQLHLFGKQMLPEIVQRAPVADLAKYIRMFGGSTYIVYTDLAPIKDEPKRMEINLKMIEDHYLTMNSADRHNKFQFEMLIYRLVDKSATESLLTLFNYIDIEKCRTIVYKEDDSEDPIDYVCGGLFKITSLLSMGEKCGPKALERFAKHSVFEEQYVFEDLLFRHLSEYKVKIERNKIYENVDTPKESCVFERYVDLLTMDPTTMHVPSYKQLLSFYRATNAPVSLTRVMMRLGHIRPSA